MLGLLSLGRERDVLLLDFVAKDRGSIALEGEIRLAKE